MIVPLGQQVPQIEAEVFLAKDSWVIGDVSLGTRVSIFFGAVLRGDILPIRVGNESNIQEHALLHTSHGRTPTILGDQVTVGHRAIVHGATVGNRVLVGMGAIILDQAIIEDECIIGAGTVITEGKKIPARSLVLGTPGRVVRTLEQDELRQLVLAAEHYVTLGRMYRGIPAVRQES